MAVDAQGGPSFRHVPCAPVPDDIGQNGPMKRIVARALLFIAIFSMAVLTFNVDVPISGSSEAGSFVMAADTAGGT